MNKLTFIQLRALLQSSLIAFLFISIVACGNDDAQSCGGAGTAFFDGSATVNNDEAAVLISAMFVDEDFMPDVRRYSFDLAVFTANCDTLYTLEILTDIPMGESLQPSYEFNGNQIGSAFGFFAIETFSDETFSQTAIDSGRIDITKSGSTYTLDLDIESVNADRVSMRVDTDFN